jgi:hypothetical protein
MCLVASMDRGLVIQPFVDRVTFSVLTMRPQIADALCSVEWTEGEFVSAVLNRAVEEFAEFYRRRSVVLGDYSATVVDCMAGMPAVSVPLVDARQVCGVQLRVYDGSAEAV